MPKEKDGRRVQFIVRGQEVVTELEEEKGMTRHIRGYDLIASDADSARTYYHYALDELGSITHVAAGEDILNRYEYDAWGNLTLCEEKVENRFKFNGQQYDPISQQYYLRARYYNPVIGRFTQEDTYRGDGLNLYAYCRNNPVYYADPSGHMSKCMRDALQRVMERDGVTQEQMDSDPDLRLRLMADASNIVKEQKRRQREQGNNSQDNEIPALPGPGPTLALPGPVLDTSGNRPSNSEADGPDNNSRQSGGSGRTSTTGENSRILSDNLAREGRAVGEGEAAAHIVASTGTKRQWASAADSRALLTKYDININDAANDIPLGHPRPHNLTHNRSFHENVNERLHAVEANMINNGYGRRAIRSALRRELRSIGKEFENGIRN